VDNESPLSGYRLTGSSPDSYELTFRPRPQRQKSCIEIVSPIFRASGTEPVSMPFAVTPFGPLTLASIFLVAVVVAWRVSDWLVDLGFLRLGLVESPGQRVLPGSLGPGWDCPFGSW
ncbi:MAG: hypothetical protein ACLQLO_18930, partial [Mycobacterium sp.]